MDTRVPSASAAVALVARLSPKCRLCTADFRRRYPSEKYCERCRGRRAPKRSSKAAEQGSASSKCPNVMEYIVHTPTFGIMTVDDERIPVMVPVGSSLCISDPLPMHELNAVIEVLWDSRQLLMFFRDVHARATRVVPREPTASVEPPADPPGT
jgi:hypothetical protein